MREDSTDREPQDALVVYTLRRKDTWSGRCVL
jgi:hypothetical protein